MTKNENSRIKSNDSLKGTHPQTEGRDEMNLCEFPFATVSNREDSRKKVLRFEITSTDKASSEPVRRSLVVKGDPEFGLPTAKDEEIYLALMKHTHEVNRFTCADVAFRRSDLLASMDWKKSTRDYRRLTLGMHRLTGVRLRYQKLWRDNNHKAYRDQGAFSILDSFEFRDEKPRDSGRYDELSSRFRWNAVLFNSFDSGYIKRIDYSLAKSLSVRARRLYRYLDKHFHPPLKTKITKDLAVLAYQHIGISPGVELDKVRKRHIGPAIEELQATAFLEQHPIEDCFQRVRPGTWLVTFDLQPSTQKQTSKNMIGLAPEMIKRGLSPDAAAKINKTNSRTAIIQAIHAMDEQFRSGTTIRNPLGWFQSALKNEYRANSTEARSKRADCRIFRGGRFVD